MRTKYGAANHDAPGYASHALHGPTAHPYDGRLGSPYEAYPGSSPSMPPAMRAPHHACSAYPSPYPPPTPPYRPSPSPFKAGAVGYGAPPTYGPREREVGTPAGTLMAWARRRAASPRMGFATGTTRPAAFQRQLPPSAVRSPSYPSSLVSPRRLPAALTNGADGIDGDEGGGRSAESVADAFRSPPLAPPWRVRWARVC